MARGGSFNYYCYWLRYIFRKDMPIYQGFVFGFLPCAYYICHLPNSHLRAQTRQIADKLSTVEIYESLAWYISHMLFWYITNATIVLNGSLTNQYFPVLEFSVWWVEKVNYILQAGIFCIVLGFWVCDFGCNGGGSWI